MVVKENFVFERKMLRQPRLDQPATYRICVHGDLNENWSARLQGLEIKSQIQEDASVITTLEGQLLDQAALMGVLVALYNLRLPLISVTWLVSIENEENDLLKVSVKQKDTYIEFIVTGTYDLETAIAKFPLVTTACQQIGFGKALIDYRGLTGEILATQEVFYAHRVGEFYQEYESAGGLPLKIAFIGKGELSPTTAKEIGKVYDLETLLTSDYQEAIEWLGKASPKGEKTNE